MKARVAGIAGSVLALTVIGGFAAASTFQSAPVAPAAVVQPAVVETVAPAVVPTTVAPAPVESTQAPVVVAPKKVVAVPKVVAPEPIVSQTAPGTYQDGTPVVRGSNGDVVLKPLPDPGSGNTGNTAEAVAGATPTTPR